MLSGWSTAKGRAFYVLTIIFQLIALIAVALRIWAKSIRKRPFAPHDYLIFAASVFSVGYAVVNLYAVYPGVIGVHTAQLRKLSPAPLPRIESTLKDLFASVFMWVSATTLIKLSVLQLYVNIFAKPLFRCSAYAIVALCVAFWLSYIIAAFSICRPLALNWNKHIRGGTCGNPNSQVISVAIINAVLDALIVALPMPVLWNLQMPTRKKWQLTGIISLALCICAINVTRIGLQATSNQQDFTWSGVDSGLLSGLEIYLGICIACLPVLSPIFNSQKFGQAASARKYPIDPSSDPSSTPSKFIRSANRGYTDLDTVNDDSVPLQDLSSVARPPAPRGHAGAWTHVRSFSPVGQTNFNREASEEDVIHVARDVTVYSSEAPKGRVGVV